MFFTSSKFQLAVVECFKDLTKSSAVRKWNLDFNNLH